MLKKVRAERARKEKWLKEQERIKALYEALKGLGGIPLNSQEIFGYAAKFFDIVSAFQDNGYIFSAPEKVREEANILNTHITHAGRSSYGINRTKCGETVTLDNTYWGGVFGLFTFTGREWARCPSAYYGFKEQWLNEEALYEENPLNNKVIADYQVLPFLRSHIAPMIQLCESLIKEA